MDINKITGIVLDACIKIHTVMGPGCFEKVYEETLHYELYERGLDVQKAKLDANLL
jgi:GxxExxY protein